MRAGGVVTSTVEVEDARERVEAAMQRLLRQPDFKASPRLGALLSFLVREALAGRQQSLKAFSIARAVYGQAALADPQAMSSIRVDALRLRTILERHYAGPGAQDAVVLRLPRGGFAPSFVFNAMESASAEPASVASAHRRKVRRIAAGVSATVVVAGLLLIGPRYGFPVQAVAARLTAAPSTSIAVAPPAPHGELRGL